MKGIYLPLAGLIGLASFVCWLIIVIDAFKNAIWKGLLALFTCGIYTLYYAIAEFQHDKKWTIIAVCYGGGFVCGILRAMALQ